MNTYTITLADGRKISNLKLNGNCFESNTEVDVAIFKNNLLTFNVMDSDGNKVWESKNVILVNQQPYGDKWLLCFAEKSQFEIYKEKQDAQQTVTEMAIVELYEKIIN